MKRSSTVIVVTLFLFTMLDAQDFSTRELLLKMQLQSPKKSIRSLTFRQRTVTHTIEGTTHEEYWLEYLQVPSKLRIEIEPADSGKGMIFAQDSVFSFDKGKLMRAAKLPHVLLLLGYDVYSEPVDHTLNKLKELQFDIQKVYETSWKGRQAYVVGAEKGDEKSNQFWIDKEMLVLVRMIQPGRRQPNFTLETQFNNYKTINGIPVETEVLFLRNGKVQTEEYYTDLKVNVPLKGELFNSGLWDSAHRK